jgi:hypothetical protein
MKVPASRSILVIEDDPAICRLVDPAEFPFSGRTGVLLRTPFSPEDLVNTIDAVLAGP